MTTPHYTAPTPPPLPAAPKNGFGVTALVLGIVGAVFAFIPVVGVIAWPLVVLGLLFGVLGILRAHSGKANNMGVAIAGTACSAVGLVLCFVWLVAFASTAPHVPAGYAPGAMSASPLAPNAPAVAPGQIPGDGTFLVGKDIKPGTYRSAGTSSLACTYTRMKDLSGSLGSIIDSGVQSQGPSVVTISPSDGAFKTSGCETWQLAQ
jgi:hypothetical protein